MKFAPEAERGGSRGVFTRKAPQTRLLFWRETKSAGEDGCLEDSDVARLPAPFGLALPQQGLSPWRRVVLTAVARTARISVDMSTTTKELHVALSGLTIYRWY